MYTSGTLQSTNSTSLAIVRAPLRGLTTEALYASSSKYYFKYYLVLHTYCFSKYKWIKTLSLKVGQSHDIIFEKKRKFKILKTF